jgi:hypothetical protein
MDESSATSPSSSSATSAAFLAIATRRVFLKVLKCDIFDRSDLHDFYTKKSLWEGGGGDFVVKIKKILINFRGFIRGCEIPFAYAQSDFRTFYELGQIKIFCEAFETIC